MDYFIYLCFVSGIILIIIVFPILLIIQYKNKKRSRNFDSKNSYWIYQILVSKSPITDSLVFAIYEVYYENNKPGHYTENPIYISGDTVEEVKDSVRMILKDIESRPVLWEGEDFPKEYKNV
jgi:hypothetical protein